MFTGIIEATGTITEVITSDGNRTFWVKSPISSELKADQSVSHNGACLTVEEIKNGQYRVTAIDETLAKTNLVSWVKGSLINLERSLTLSSRLDGHIVQGHVDSIAKCIAVIEKNGSREFSFVFDKKFATLIIEKGSITINGISLTLFNAKENEFTVAIIPYTFEHTNIKTLKTGDDVNIEFDIIGKYVNRIAQLKI